MSLRGSLVAPDDFELRLQEQTTGLMWPLARQLGNASLRTCCDFRSIISKHGTGLPQAQQVSTNPWVPERIGSTSYHRRAKWQYQLMHKCVAVDRFLQLTGLQ